MTPSIRHFGPFLILPSLLIGSAALAQEAPPPPPARPTIFDRDYLTVGAGAAYGPGYEGSDSYVVYPVAGFLGRIGGFTISPRPAGLAIDLIRDPRDARVSFTAGPVGRLRFDRSRQIRDPAVAALGQLDTAIEIGGNVGISINRITNPYDSLSFGVDMRWDVNGAHRGRVIVPTISFLSPVSRAAGVALTVTAEHVDDNYANYYFGVTPAGRARSGLPVYDAHSGFKNASATLICAYDLNGDLTDGGFVLVAGLSYSRLLGNFATSPIVSLRGAKDQLISAVGLAYTF
ncbi:MAG: MipA/OmpV family protein [Sphingomonadales bacterium]|nr:MipA/OmpV family protein [Sphingomonadales bacterium]